MTDPRSRKAKEVPFRYPGRPLAVFRVGVGPDGRLYASTMLPARLLRLDDATGRFEELGELGGGEVYSFLGAGERLLMAAYACGQPLLALDPRKPVRPAGGPGANPTAPSFPDGIESWRPLALAMGADGRAYAGAIAPYGRRAGPLAAWDLTSGKVEQSLPFDDQGISALAAWKSQLVGGTTKAVGGGAKAGPSEAQVFLWDPVARKVTFKVTPVPGAIAVESLAVGPDQLVYGIAGGKLFVLDPAAARVVDSRPLPFPGGTVHGSLALGPDGRLWGLGMHPAAGVFAVDPATRTVELVLKLPRPITGGFALRERRLFFLSGPDLFALELPARG